VRCAFFDGNLHSEFTLEEYFEDAVGSHACSFEASMRVTNGIPIGRSLLLPVDIVNCVTPLKAQDGIDSVIALMTSHHCRHKMAFVGLTIDSVTALMTLHHCRHKMAFVGLCRCTDDVAPLQAQDGLCWTYHRLCHCTDDVAPLQAQDGLCWTNHRLCHCTDDVAPLQAQDGLCWTNRCIQCLSLYGARFQTELCTRGYHLFPRMFP